MKQTDISELREFDLRTTVAATFSLDEPGPSEQYGRRSYLFLAACVHRMDISLDLLEAASPQAFEDALRRLDRYALVSRRPAESAFDVHRLVHHVLRWMLQGQEQLQAWIQRTITQLLRVFLDDGHSHRGKWRRLLPDASYVLSNSQRDDINEDRLDIAWKCAMILYGDGQYNDAKELFVQIMHARRRLLRYKHPHTLATIGNLASTYRNQGR
jgi:hypothetical protein